MHYIIYKTTNLVNGKFYIGKHQTNDLNDGYVGSGKLLKRAIKKYGMDQFKTEIIEMCSTEAHMNLAEKIYVVVDDEVSYNLCPGGKGGFGYINKTITKEVRQRNGSKGGRISYAKYGNKFGPREITKRIATRRMNYELGKYKHKLPQKHSEESKNKISASKKGKQTGKTNSQFNTCWVTNGEHNKKIKKQDIELWNSLGYYKGRKLS